MTELNSVEISVVTGGAGEGGDIDWWALDDFNREQMEEIMRRHSSRTFTPPVY